MDLTPSDGHQACSDVCSGRRCSDEESVPAATRTRPVFTAEFKLGVVEADLAGEGSLRGKANKAGVDRSLVHYWLKTNHAGELPLDLQREEASVETAQHFAALERKVSQITIEADLRNRGLIAAPATSSGQSLIISGQVASPPGEAVE